ncbi:DUF2325 domain-containing protein [Ectobacillus antri]|uniref:DUF2325 domain-containing protein n=1 Tax=Ectobacillus antri TaxID=2486280 RepID=A0ABT6H8I6_9BACI|nr:DUF2325 domain-containing protein [Ectobacillus antri]MDG4658208.1 DUF2325 domain-containing protein [Ectobacillus antri]MDG5755272.1 DUF2325 domain-containing protein [Ectobacillus antri]
MKKIAIIGGDNQKGYEKRLKTTYEVKCHDGRMKRTGVKTYFTNLLKDVECVIIILTAVSHGTMYAVKEVAHELGVKVIYQRSKGVSSIVRAIHAEVVFS